MGGFVKVCSVLCGIFAFLSAIFFGIIKISPDSYDASIVTEFSKWSFVITLGICFIIKISVLKVGLGNDTEAPHE